MNTDYDEMLDQAYSKLPQEILEHKRFSLPTSYSSLAGSRTIIHNFKEICDDLNRKPQHLLKYLSGELATAGSSDGTRALFQGRFDRGSINRLIKRYAMEFIVCPICKRPDTNILKEKRLYFLLCEACGAKSSVRQV